MSDPYAIMELPNRKENGMWILLDVGFVSIVQHKDDAALMLVRARVRADLEAFSDLHAAEYGHALAIVEDPTADYRWRTTVARPAVAVLLAKKIMDLDYDSHVKDIAIERSAPNAARTEAYYQTWSAMNEMQLVEVYGSGERYSRGRFDDEY